MLISDVNWCTVPKEDRDAPGLASLGSIVQGCSAVYVLFVDFGSILYENSDNVDELFTVVVDGVEQSCFSSGIFLINHIGCLELYLQAFIVGPAGCVMNGCAHFVIFYNHLDIVIDEDLARSLIPGVVQRGFQLSIPSI